MKKIKIGLLPRVLIAIVLGVTLGNFLPLWAVRIFVTFNDVFGHFLSFLIPLIIIGLVTPAIGDIGKNAGKLLLLTAAIAYGDTVFSGFFSYFTSASLFPSLISSHAAETIAETDAIEPFFTINIPPMVDVMSALIFSFIVGLGIATSGATTLKRFFDEFQRIIAKTIEKALIPLLPLYIMGIFMGMAYTGQAWRIVQTFVAIIGIIFAMHIILLMVQYAIAGAIVGRNPFKLLWKMLPAYFTALGTSSSAATIPVTLRQTIDNGVDRGIAGFTVPLCATIHLSGSAMKITACAVALMVMQGMHFDVTLFSGFILMLGVMMVAAPGVPGGAIMAALGVLQSILGFDVSQQALMIALYITMDSFGTACNVTGDGAIALIVNRIAGRKATEQPV
ncbi:MAG: dicarboxylate/amino acid:cation symporter [Muribaculaceae bacterium]|nr:dicarboxylate/amino acid:cation symporter [Muribaculaceae bacterium]